MSENDGACIGDEYREIFVFIYLLRLILHPPVGIFRACLVTRASMPHSVQPDPMSNEKFRNGYIQPGCLSVLHTASLNNKKDSLRRFPPPAAPPNQPPKGFIF